MMEYQEEIQGRREEIDKIDEVVMFLLDKRMDLASQIGDIKRTCNVPVYQNGREEEILNWAERSRYGETIVKDISLILNSQRQVGEIFKSLTILEIFIMLL